MKNQNLFSALAALILILSAAGPVLKAQTLPENLQYATDVRVTQLVNASEMTSKLAVANNGWIYSLAQFYAYDGTNSWLLNCSKDGGRTFMAVAGKDYDPMQAFLGQVDFAVTGEDSATIKLFVAEALTKGPTGNEDSYCSISTYDAAGQKTGTPYMFHWGTNLISNLAIATDFRAPDFWQANPYNVVLAWTGTDLAGSSDHLTYAYSSDGGLTFTNYFLYDQPLPGHLGKVSIAIGMASDFFSAIFGVAFELNKIGNNSEIGVIMNSLFLGGGWTAPAIVSSNINSNPVISFKQKSPSVIPATNYFSSIVGYQSNATNGETYLNYCYLDYQYFTSGIPQATGSDFAKFMLEPTLVTRQLDVNYDKNSDKFLFTWYSESNKNLWYATLPSLDPTALEEKGFYRDLSSVVDWGIFPRVDINPVRGKSCFSWIEHKTTGDNVCFDSEWSAVGMEEPSGKMEKTLFSIFPNPAGEQCVINYSGSLTAEATLTDMNGHIIRHFNISRGSTSLNTNDLKPGVYRISLHNEQGLSSQKLIVR